MKTIQNSKEGQALIMLLLFMVIGIIITSAAIVLIGVNASGTTKFQQGTKVYGLAEAGAENALIRLLRDPSYSGETLTTPDGSALITVTGTLPNKTIVSEGHVGNFVRKIEVITVYNNNELTVSSWREIY